MESTLEAHFGGTTPSFEELVSEMEKEHSFEKDWFAFFSKAKTNNVEKLDQTKNGII